LISVGENQWKKIRLKAKTTKFWREYFDTSHGKYQEDWKILKRKSL
jgi:hypothetical protein